MNILRKILIILLVLILTTASQCVYGTIDVDTYKPDTVTIGTAGPAAGFIIKTIQVVGVILGTIGIALLGLRYMLGSASEKAEFKETAWPYIIGVALLFGTSGILQIIASVI